jgi:DNA-binding MarR family transcriptional regulator
MDDVRPLTPEQVRAWEKLVAFVELLPGVLDSQLQHDADLTHFEYSVLAILHGAPNNKLRMTALAARTNSTLPRLSHVVSRLEARGYIDRTPCEEDRRATNAELTRAGCDKVVHTTPGHVTTVRETVIDPLDDHDVAELDRIMAKLLGTLGTLDSGEQLAERNVENV